ncbi:MAG: SOS response-associated peptidase [Gammaproteobacteria bacterium]|nr:SOS response-associated peptidase [Gammaproteobacteria bacterium]
MNVHDHEGVQAFLDDLGLSLQRERFTPRYNLAPSDPVHTLFADRELELAEMRWGLLPRNPKQRGLLINARAETAWEKPSFRDAMHRRRAVLPVNGFYEWLREGTDKSPFYVTGQDRVLALAGLFAVDTEGEMRCCVLTTAANDSMSVIHDRMPVCLPPGSVRDWLTSDDRDSLDALVAGAQRQVLNLLPVSKFVNSSRNDGPQCIAPATS